MKNILFVMESLRIGGAEKSLLTILSMLDPTEYNINLFLFRHSGEFFSQIPSYVNLLPEDENVRPFLTDFKTAWIQYATIGQWKRAACAFGWTASCFVSKYICHEPEYVGWKWKKGLFSNLPTSYDVAIGFLEKATTYFVVDKVKAKKKIAFMHTDYDAISHDEALDKVYYEKLDNLVCVSEHTKETMLCHFAFLEGKAVVIRNMVSTELIRKMAEEPCPELEACPKDVVKLVTVGRLTPPKKIDGAVDIMNALRKKGVNAEWFVVGEGEQRLELEKKIQALGLQNAFHLLGARANPYPYMKNCDIYVQPSRWEGYGITVAEAKVLCKPIVASDIPEFREQIEDGVSGLIGAEGEIAEQIRRLTVDKAMRDKLSYNLRSTHFSSRDMETFKRITG